MDTFEHIDLTEHRISDHEIARAAREYYSALRSEDRDSCIPFGKLLEILKHEYERNHE